MFSTVLSNLVASSYVTDWIIVTLLFSVPPHITPFSFGEETVNEGEFVQVTCNVRSGDSPLTITWSLKGDTISSEPDITTTMIGPRTSILMINYVGYRHSGEYICTARNKAGSDSYSTSLRVNGRRM